VGRKKGKGKGREGKKSERRGGKGTENRPRGGDGREVSRPICASVQNGR